MILQEYIRRRQEFLLKMKSGSAALIFAAPETKRNAKNVYPYRQNSDFLYFTGFNEPQALLILIKNYSNQHYSILFNQVRNKVSKIWTGYRLGQEMALESLNVSRALPWDEIENQLYLLLNGLNIVYHAQGEYRFADKLLFSALDKLRMGTRQKLHVPTMLIDWRPLVHEMRLIKSEEELKVIRRACKITAIAHTRAMQKCHPGLYEYHLEGEIQYEFNRQGARFPSYNTIVGSGNNSCILHYTENSACMKSGDLVLIDAGCEYYGYASDISRTFPVNGRFSQEQRVLYELVLSMLNHALKRYGPGRSIQEVTEEVVRIMITGLVKIGVIKGKIETLIATKVHRQFFMHNLTHWLGLDVHDIDDYNSSKQSRILEPGMVLSVEPGIYITKDANVPVHYRGIGIRIEDTIVINTMGNENLTDSAVKKVEEIETLMKKVAKE